MPLGRDSKALQETVAAAQESAMATAFKMDLTVKENLETLVSHLDENGGKVDILVHSAGVIHQNPMERARIADFDCQYATNVRAPYLFNAALVAVFDEGAGTSCQASPLKWRVTMATCCSTLCGRGYPC